MIGAVDIGGTKIAVGMVDESGKVLSRMESPTGIDFGYADGLELIAGMLRETARNASVEISGIGIGSTGPVDPFTGEFGDIDFLPQMAKEEPGRRSGTNFKVRMALENDAAAAALAEAGWALEKQSHDWCMSRSEPALVEASSWMENSIVEWREPIPKLAII